MRHAFVISTLIGILLSTGAFGFAGETIRLASGEWPPYQSAAFKHAGVVTRIVTEAFSLQNVQVELGYFPWTRAFHYAQTGRWDGTFVWFETPERHQFFYISDPVIHINVVLFHHKSFALEWHTINDLRRFRIGATLGYDYGPDFQQAESEKTIWVVRKPSDAENLVRLINYQIQLFPCDLEVGYALIQQHADADQAQQLTHHPHPVRSAPHHLLLSKKVSRNKHLIALFNRGLQQLKSTGKLDQYMAESRRGDYRP